MALARATTSVLAVEGGDGGDRAEGLLAHDQRIVGHVGEQRRLDRTVVPAAWRLPPARQRAPRGDRVGDLLLDLGDGALVHQRADVGAVGQAVRRP